MGYTIRAPKAIKLTAEQAAERRAAAHAYARQLAADESARRLAERATQPVPEYATWVFDSTGKKIGYMTADGIVPVADPVVDETPAAVVIVPCGGKKAPGRLAAAAKYVGSYHAATRRAAAAIVGAGRVLILSARYGLLQLADLVDDYDLRMGRPGSVTPAQIAAQAAALGITDADVTVLAGKAYADVVTAVWPAAVCPLDGTRSMGEQLARMAAMARSEPPAPAPSDAAPADQVDQFALAA